MWRELRAVREAEPLAPVVVLVPTSLLRRHLTATAADRGGAINVHFLTLLGIARRIAEPVLAREGRVAGCGGTGFQPVAPPSQAHRQDACATDARVALPPFGGEIIVRSVSRAARVAGSGGTGFQPVAPPSQAHRQDACATDARYFASLADRPGFHRALLATIADLKEASHAPADLERAVARLVARGSQLAARSVTSLAAKLRDLAALWSAYEARLADLRLHDSSDLLVAAGRAAPRDPWLSRAAAVFVYGFYDLNELQRRLVAAVASRVPSCAFFPFEPGRAAFQYAEPTFAWFREHGFEPRAEAESPVPAELDRLARRLFEPPGGEPGARGGTGFQPVAAMAPPHRQDACATDACPEARLRIISAPDEVREVKEVLRASLAASSRELRAASVGVGKPEARSSKLAARSLAPLPRVGILLRQTAAYAPLFAEECELGDLAAYHHDPPPLSTARSGRSLLLLLRLLESDLGRADVMDFATYADIPFGELLGRPEGRPVATADWDLWSIEAGVVKGRESWARRLSALRRRLAETEDEGPELQERLDQLDALAAFIVALGGALEEVPRDGTWSELVGSVLGVFRRFVRAGDERTGVEESIGSLAALDATGERADLLTFGRLASEALDAQLPARPPFGSCGPVVADLMEARGLPFDVVCVPGLVEKVFPALAGPDPLLSDEERGRLGSVGIELPMKGRRALEEQLLFRLAVGAAASSVVLSYPRMEASGRERVPSHFLLRAVEAVTGARCTYEGLERYPGRVRVSASAFAPSAPEAAWREAEYDLAAVRLAVAGGRGDEVAFLAAVSPTVAAGIRAESRRWGEARFTPYDGVLSAEALPLLAAKLGATPLRLSASALERYAECPFRFFLEQVLKVGQLEEPEDVRRLSSADRGRVIHRILFRALRRARREHRLPLRVEDERLVLDAARESLAEFEQQGVVGSTALWDLDRAAVELDLRRLVGDEAAEAPDYCPAHFEASFGHRPSEDTDSLWNSEGLVFDLGEAATLQVTGRIDRIDLDRERTRGRVLDYKTGSPFGKPRDDALMGGTALQLPLYLKAAEALLPNARMEVALFRYLADRSVARFTRAGYERRESDLKTVLATIAEGIRQGRFFAGVPKAPCRSCPFTLVCGAAAEAAARIKLADEAIEHYLAMRTQIE